MNLVQRTAAQLDCTPSQAALYINLRNTGHSAFKAIRTVNTTPVQPKHDAHVMAHLLEFCEILPL